MSTVGQISQLMAMMLCVDGVVGLLFPPVVKDIYRRWLDPKVVDPILGNSRMSGFCLILVAISWLHLRLPLEGLMDWASSTGAIFLIFCGCTLMIPTIEARMEGVRMLDRYTSGQVRFVGLVELLIGGTVLLIFEIFS